MSYCRFENTYRDLRDCLDALESGDEVSENEAVYRRNLVELCGEIARDYAEFSGKGRQVCRSDGKVVTVTVPKD